MFSASSVKGKEDGDGEKSDVDGLEKTQTIPKPKNVTLQKRAGVFLISRHLKN